MGTFLMPKTEGKDSPHTRRAFRFLPCPPPATKESGELAETKVWLGGTGAYHPLRGLGTRTQQGTDMGTWGGDVRKTLIGERGHAASI